MNKLESNDDHALIRLISNGNESALGILYNRYYEMLCRSAFKRLQDEAIVEELVQDVFINLWNKAASLDHEGNIKSYLFATLRNKVLHQIRSGMVMAKHTLYLSKQDDVYVPDSFELLHAKNLEQKFNSIVKEMPPQCREAFTLSRFENLSYKCIADRMEISVNTVEKHIGKALNILRKSFREFGITLPLISIAYYLFK